MEVFVTFLLLLFLPGVAGAIASRKGRGMGWFFLTLLAGVVPGAVALNISQNDAVGALVGLFFSVISITMVAFARSAEKVAQERGAYGEYVKCPYCAEPVRREAQLCRHCRSDLQPGGA